MNDFFTGLRAFYDDVWAESPWLKSMGIVATAVTVLGILNTELPDAVALKLRDGSTAEMVLGTVVLVYFFLVAVFSADRLRFERKLRKLEQSFRYDKRGTLYNGNQPNIAFRIKTFKSILEGLSGAVGQAQLEAGLRETGAAASADFAEQLPSIYNQDVTKRGGGRRWDDLSFNEKVHSWADYDSSTGWGIVTGDPKGSRVLVTITHLRNLFKGTGGTLFSQFLAGYCETVIAHIAAGHEAGRYQDFSRAEVLELKRISEKTMTIEIGLG